MLWPLVPFYEVLAVIAYIHAPLVGTEIDLIEIVAADIIRKLDSASMMSESTGLIGIDSRIEDIKKILSTESIGVQFIGIWGMGGIGKSKSVEVLYNQISNQFHASYFVEDVSQEPVDKLASLRTTILSKILGSEMDQGSPNRPPASVIRRLRTKKILIVLDNISSSEQVTTLVGSKSDCWFGSGSKVIIISRDRQVLDGEDMAVYEVKELSPHDSIQLFCLKAFKRNQPPEDYRNLSQKIVNYAKGIPLVLKVMGSRLYKRTKEQWESTLEKLDGSMDLQIEEVLKMSYDDLDWKEKMIFLDIACYFRGECKNKVKHILDGCGFSASIGITRLIEKCLVTVSSDNKLEMHDLIQKMGWQIVQQEATCKLGVCSRLWKPIDIYSLLTSKVGAKAIEGIFLDASKIQKLDVHPMAFSEMENLRLIKFYQGPFSFDYSHESRISFSDGIRSLPNNLRLIHWDEYPCESLPSDFSAENLVELNMPNSQIIRLWDGFKHLSKLKVLDLTGCENLISLPDLSSAIKLEKIILDDCRSLSEIHVSIQVLPNVSHVSLRRCKIESLPSLTDMKSLKTLDLYECSDLKKFPKTSAEIEVLNLFDTKIKEWPQSMSSLNNLKDFTPSKHLRSLPSTIYLNALKSITFSHCWKLMEFPEIIGNIEKLDLSFTAIQELPPSIVNLNSLIELNLKHCRDLTSLPSNISQLRRLEKLKLTSCWKLFKQPLSLSGLDSVKELCLGGCGLSEFPVWLSTLSSLQKLMLCSNRLETVPESIKRLCRLEVLDLSYCSKLESLPELPPQVNDLAVYYCKSLKTISSSFIARRDGELAKPQFSISKLAHHRFSFTDCESLEQDASSQIVVNAHMRIQQMADSTNKDLIWPLRVSVPGNEIPKCFDQCEGSSINTKLPFNWCSDNFVGFVLYVIAYTKDSSNVSLRPKGANINCLCDFRKDDGVNVDSWEILYGIRETDSFDKKTLVVYYTGDIYSGSRGSVFCKEKHRDITHVNFGFRGLQCKVLQCGFDLVYAQIESNGRVIGRKRENGAFVVTETRVVSRRADPISEGHRAGIKTIFF